jgi:hypothetical protein
MEKEDIDIIVRTTAGREDVVKRALSKIFAGISLGPYKPFKNSGGYYQSEATVQADFLDAHERMHKIMERKDCYKGAVVRAEAGCVGRNARFTIIVP